MRRVVVTGVGVVTPVGNDARSFWQALLAGRSGVRPITGFSTEKLRSDIAATVEGFDPLRYMSEKESEIYGFVTQMSLAAAVEAMQHAGLGHLERRDERGDGDEDDER
jgi:3-oxoacyl-[acyl-carrier-protein] synthase II